MGACVSNSLSISCAIDISDSPVGEVRFCETANLSGRFGTLARTLENPVPAFVHVLAMFRIHPAKPVVVELDQRATVHFAQPVLHVGRKRIGGKHWPNELKQRRPLNCLHMSPEVTVLVTQ